MINFINHEWDDDIKLPSNLINITDNETYQRLFIIYLAFIEYAIWPNNIGTWVTGVMQSSKLVSEIEKRIKKEEFVIPEEKKIIGKFSEFISNNLTCSIDLNLWNDQKLFINTRINQSYFDYLKRNCQNGNKDIKTYFKNVILYMLGYASRGEMNSLASSKGELNTKLPLEYYENYQNAKSLVQKCKRVLDLSTSSKRFEINDPDVEHFAICANQYECIVNQIVSYFTYNINNIYEGNIYDVGDIGQFDLVYLELLGIKTLGDEINGVMPPSIEYIKDKENDYLENRKLKIDIDTKSFWFAIERILSMLSKNGKAVIMMPLSALISEKEKSIREYYVENGYIEQVLLSEIDKKQTIIVFSKGNKNIKVGIGEEKVVSFEEIKNKNYRLVYNALIVKKEEYDEYVCIQDVVKDPSTDVFRCRKYYAEKDKYKKEHTNDVVGPYGMITPKELDYGIFQFNDWEKEVDSEEVEASYYIDKNSENQYVLRSKEDVLISCKYSVFKAAVYDNHVQNLKHIPSDNVIVIRVDKEKMNPYYLAAYLNSKKGQEQISLIAQGDKTKSISPSALKEFVIPLYEDSLMKKLSNEYQKYIELADKYKREIEVKHQIVKTAFDN